MGSASVNLIRHKHQQQTLNYGNENHYHGAPQLRQYQRRKEDQSHVRVLVNKAKDEAQARLRKRGLEGQESLAWRPFCEQGPALALRPIILTPEPVFEAAEGQQGREAVHADRLGEEAEGHPGPGRGTPPIRSGEQHDEAPQPGFEERKGCQNCQEGQIWQQGNLSCHAMKGSSQILISHLKYQRLSRSRISNLKVTVEQTLISIPARNQGTAHT